MFDRRTLFVAAALLAWSGVVYSQTKPQPQDKTGTLSAEQRQAKPSPATNSLTPEQITKAITDGVEAATKQYEANHRPPPPDNSGWWFNFWLVVFTGGLVAVGGTQCFLIFWTLKATQTAANAAQQAINLAQAEFVSSHRPKIRIKHVWLVALGSNQPVTVEIVYVNVGDAKAIVSKIGMDFNVINPDAQLPPGMTPPERSYIKYSEIGLGVTVSTGNVTSLGSLDEWRVAAIRDGAKLLCCFGFIEYSDARADETRKIRKTTFCRIYRPSLRTIDGMGRFVKPEQPDPDYEYED